MPSILTRLMLFFYFALSVGLAWTSAGLAEDAVNAPFAYSAAFKCFESGTAMETVLKDGTLKTMGEVENLGYISADCWSRITLENFRESNKTLYIESPYGAILDTVEYFHYTQGTLKKMGILGMSHAFEAREVPYHVPVFSIQAEAGVNDIWIKQNARDRTAIAWQIYEPKDFISQALMAQLFLGGFFAIWIVLSFYNLSIFFVSKEWSHLFYSLYLVLFALGQMYVVGIGKQYLAPNFPAYENGLGISPITLALASMVGFVYFFLDIREYSKATKLLLAGYLLVLFVSIIIITFGPYQLGCIMTISSAGLGSVVVTVVAIEALRRKHIMAKCFAVAWSALVVGNALQVLSLALLTPSQITSTAAPFLGATIEIVLISYALAQKMRIEKIKAISDFNQKILDVKQDHIENLDRQVEEKTQSIKSILSSVNQAIITLSLDSNGLPVVAGDWSAHVKEILSREPSEGMLLSHLALSRTNLSEEETSQVEQSLSAMIGEPSFAFELNKHLLPKYVHFNKPPNERYLNLYWDPIIAFETIKYMILTVIDITDETEALALSKAKDAEMDVVVSAVKLGEASVKNILGEAALIAMKLEEASFGSDINIVKRHLHTAKGIFRAGGFKQVSEAIHNMESSLLSIQSAKEVMEISSEYISTVSGIRSILENYLHWKIVESDDISEATPKSLSFEEILLVPSLAAVDAARALNKPRPEITTLGHEMVSFALKEAYALREALLHGFTNAIDHGIESEEERLAKGKNPFGTIRVILSEVSGGISVTVEDDGRGLAVDRLAQKAVNKNEPVTDEDAANFIFASGVSTKDLVSSISGRGVGLDAAKKGLNEIGGDITVNFTAPKENGMRPFHLVIFLPTSKGPLNAPLEQKVS